MQKNLRNKPLVKREIKLNKNLVNLIKGMKIEQCKRSCIGKIYKMKEERTNYGRKLRKKRLSLMKGKDRVKFGKQ